VYSLLGVILVDSVNIGLDHHGGRRRPLRSLLLIKM
jgi:hypothetical protein